MDKHRWNLKKTKSSRQLLFVVTWMKTESRIGANHFSVFGVVKNRFIGVKPGQCTFHASHEPISLLATIESWLEQTERKLIHSSWKNLSLQSFQICFRPHFFPSNCAHSPCSMGHWIHRGARNCSYSSLEDWPCDLLSNAMRCDLECDWATEQSLFLLCCRHKKC